MEFAYSQSSAIGLFAGAEIHQHGVTSGVLQKLPEYAQEKAISETTMVQLCGSGDGRGADYSLGIVATSAKNLGFVQQAVKTWASGKCVSAGSTGGKDSWIKVSIRVPVPVGSGALSPNGIEASWASNNTNTSPALVGVRSVSLLGIRGRLPHDDGAGGRRVLGRGQRCDISESDLQRFNRANLCSTLIRDEVVCCSSGTLPSTLPPGNSDGTCKTRSVISGDDCGSLASKCGISAADFMKVNTKANPCATLTVSQQVCCTDGRYPDLKPKPDANGKLCHVLDEAWRQLLYGCGKSRDLTQTELENFNKNTRGWNGCKPEVLYPDFLRCVSTGNAAHACYRSERRLWADNEWHRQTTRRHQYFYAQSVFPECV